MPIKLIYVQLTGADIALRLHPIFPLLGRVALRDTELPVGGGTDQSEPIFIAKGMMSVMSYYAVHRNEDVFGSGCQRARPPPFYPSRLVAQSFPRSYPVEPCQSGFKASPPLVSSPVSQTLENHATGGGPSYVSGPRTKAIKEVKTDKRVLG